MWHVRNVGRANKEVQPRVTDDPTGQTCPGTLAICTHGAARRSFDWAKPVGD